MSSGEQLLKMNELEAVQHLHHNNNQMNHHHYDAGDAMT
jgi:hypothetical protein